LLETNNQKKVGGICVNCAIIMTDQQQEAEIAVGGEELPLDEPLDEPLEDQPLTESVPKEKKKKKKTVEITYEEYEAIKLTIARHLQALESEGRANLTWDQVIEWYMDECRTNGTIGDSVDEIENMKMKSDLVIKNVMAAEEVLVSVGVAPAHKKERGKTVLAVHPDYVEPEINEDDEYVGDDIEEGTYLEDEYDDEYDDDREGDFYTYEDLEEYAEKLERSKGFLLEAGERRSSLLRLACVCCCCWVVIAVIASALLLTRDDPGTSSTTFSRVQTPAPTVSARPSAVPSIAPTTPIPSSVPTPPTTNAPSSVPSISSAPSFSAAPSNVPTEPPTSSPTRDPNKLYFPVESDTFLQSGKSSDRGFGTTNSLLVVKNSGYESAVLLQFNLTGLPLLEDDKYGREESSVVLRVQHIGGDLSYPAPKVTISRLSLEGVIDVEDLTWDNYTSSLLGEESGETITLFNGVVIYEFDIYDLLEPTSNPYPPNGLVVLALRTLDLSNPFGESFISREGGEENAPLVFYENSDLIANSTIVAPNDFTANASCAEEPCI
jgi:hypothetical protein